jgi:succinylglutamate desuccinylase
MKGYRTIVFNALMLVAGIAGNEVAPDLMIQFVDAFLAAWAVGNVILRRITDSPIFSDR